MDIYIYIHIYRYVALTLPSFEAACIYIYCKHFLIVYTVEPRLTDTPQIRTPAIRRTVQEVLNVAIAIDFCTLNPLNCGHPATP